ncbi:hypothetical protein Fmac_014611 [Flemingia macrophylla]|uniref:non-specific serine/threonine protein kinase n=1 Tax=Flemingia macrophylla TaxID=520843 RepID=A0ABD1MC78_9FABA
MDSENVGSYEMRVDALRSYSERVDSLIRSETASFYGDSPLYTFDSRVDSAIRSSCASYEEDYEPHSSTTTNVNSQELSLPDSHNNPYCQILTQHSNELSSGILRAPRIRWTTTPPSHLKRFAFNELETATRRFSPDGIVGGGGFGSVFKGWINEQTLAPAEPGTGMEIAVKRNDQKSRQGHSEWLNEIKYLGQLRHPNIVKLIGYSSENNHLILVYEFIGKGSLASHLYGRSSKCETLSWTIRKKVALDLAKVLAFLHSDEVHSYSAKLGDFGLVINGPEGDESYASTTLTNGPEGDGSYASRTLTNGPEGDESYASTTLTNGPEGDESYVSTMLINGPERDESHVSTTLINGAERDESHVSTGIKGTLGYISPEYAIAVAKSSKKLLFLYIYLETCYLTKKNDVYGFGVVLLELMSGRHVLDRNRSKRKHFLVDWAKPLIDRKRISKVMDARIKGQYSEREAGRIAHLAIQCLSTVPKLRPTMDEVVRSLEHLQDSETHR